MKKKSREPKIIEIPNNMKTIACLLKIRRGLRKMRLKQMLSVSTLKIIT